MVNSTRNHIPCYDECESTYSNLAVPAVHSERFGYRIARKQTLDAGPHHFRSHFNKPWSYRSTHQKDFICTSVLERSQKRCASHAFVPQDSNNILEYSIQLGIRNTANKWDCWNWHYSFALHRKIAERLQQKAGRSGGNLMSFCIAAFVLLRVIIASLWLLYHVPNTSSYCGS